MNNIAPSEQAKIRDYLHSGQKIAAIIYYRYVTGCDLSSAKSKIEIYIQKERLIHPDAFQGIDKSGLNKKISFVWIMTFLIALLFSFNSLNLDFNQLTKLFSAKNLTAFLENQQWFSDIQSLIDQNTISRAPSIKKNQSSLVLPSGQNTQLQNNHSNPVVTNSNETGKPLTMLQLFQAKLANIDYINRKNAKGVPKGYQDFPEEVLIKKLRSEFAAKQTLPVNETAEIIPLSNQQSPDIDGLISRQEWQNSLKLRTKPSSDGTTIYLKADNKWLYIAADVPKDTTEKGFDQLRFYFHINLLPEIKNERIHVRGGRSTRIRFLKGYRSTTIRWSGTPVTGKNERWKKYPITDWRIYKQAQGASSMAEHRQYEAKILLSEAGLHQNVVFASYIVVETDPQRKENGKFKKRQYLGRLGNSKKPQWFIIR